MHKIIIGTRGSQLALWQAEHIKSLVEKSGQVACLLKVIKTRGDKDLNTPLPEVGSKGFFTAEIEGELRRHSIDLAVHSLKDLPVEMEADLALGAVPRRGSPRDVLVLPNGVSFGELPKKARIATGSNRRRVQLLELIPGADTVNVRGNISTRLAKMEKMGWDALVMAEVALERLKLSDVPRYPFPIAKMVPAAGQGAIAVQTAKDRTDLQYILGLINHERSFLAVMAERKLIRLLEGGCQVPAGTHVDIIGKKVEIHAFIATLDNRRNIRIHRQGETEQLEQLVKACLAEFQQRGVKEIIHENRKMGLTR
ncbi:hydroxymethylbilane synthase [Caldithrix abyssi]|nr:hydroxymethylbilane synthase [Caldithrix abyssi]